MADEVAMEIVPEASAAAIQAFSDSIAKSLAGALGKALTSPVQQSVEKAVEQTNLAKKIGSAVGAIGAGSLRTAGGAAGGAQGVASAMAGGGPEMAAVGQAIGLITNLVNQFNPAVVEQLNLAFTDIAATIGATLTPVVQFLTPLVQMWGDAIATILPDYNTMQELMGAFQPLMDELKTQMSDLAPAIGAIVEAFVTTLIPIIHFLAESIAWFANKIKWLLPTTWLAHSGMTEPGFKKTARGMTAGSSGAVSVEGLGKEMQIAALRVGGSWQQRAAEAAERSNDLLDQIAGNTQKNHSGGYKR